MEVSIPIIVIVIAVLVQIILEILKIVPFLRFAELKHKEYELEQKKESKSDIELEEFNEVLFWKQLKVVVFMILGIVVGIILCLIFKDTKESFYFFVEGSYFKDAIFTGILTGTGSKPAHDLFQMFKK